MTPATIHFLIVVLLLLILLSAFFSGAETGMMSLNRYRLRHLARKGQVAAQRMYQLLERPDRLLGVILIGNTFATIVASALSTLISVYYFGEYSVIFSTIVLTLVVLVVAEIAPKTLAALYPERVAKPASWLLQRILKVIYPLVWLMNTLSNGLLRLFGVEVKKQSVEPLSAEELRSVVREAGDKISNGYRQLLLRILEIESMVVEDVMIPASEIYGIDLNQPWDKIVRSIEHCRYSYAPVYHNTLERVEGMLNVERALRLLARDTLTELELKNVVEAVYFIPEGASVSVQLINFQTQQCQAAMVVDEYGDIQGLLSLKDIVEEVVGEFTTPIETHDQFIREQSDGTFLVNAGVNLRELNRITGWNLPMNGPKTLSGLIIEQLETIPRRPVGLKIRNYCIEVNKVHKTKISTVRIWQQ